MIKTPKKYKRDLYWVIQDKYNGKRPRVGKRLAKLAEDLKRLKQGEPLDYIIGWKPFLDCKIDFSYKPHVPEPETEFWVEKFIAYLKGGREVEEVKVKKSKGEKEKMVKSNAKFNLSHLSHFSPSSPLAHLAPVSRLKILDAFSGSGCIGIAVLKAIRKARVDFAEYEPRLIKQIKYNLKINRISPSRYRVIHSNILKNVRMSYDYILANPPYVATKRKHKLKSWVIKYWPMEALLGGKDGLYFIRRFLKQAKSRLALPKAGSDSFYPGGQIWMEFDPRQKKAIARIIKKNKYSSHTFHRDQYNRLRFVIITL